MKSLLSIALVTVSIAFTHFAFAEEQAEAVLKPGRYVLIKTTADVISPETVRIKKEESGKLILISENPHVSSEITLFNSSLSFHIDKTSSKAPPSGQNWIQNRYFTFAGTPSRTNPRSFEGVFTQVFTFYNSGDNQPKSEQGRFLLYPIDEIAEQGAAANP